AVGQDIGNTKQQDGDRTYFGNAVHTKTGKSGNHSKHRDNPVIPAINDLLQVILQLAYLVGFFAMLGQIKGFKT
ncbi:MAG: hypothetical protein ACI92A_002496, partial [Candidatus Paceibacteria bacterium]